MRKSVARLVAAVLVIAPLAACHSIERGDFAHGPVPQSVLALREPVTYTVGANAGQVVETRHGLLASYFNGANYVQPSYGEYLDHQQIDPNVDFTWDGSNTNPVIPAGHGGIDVSEGDPFLPDHWPIWSVVWEGYLDVPADGTYAFRLHVNNGGWLEMKDSTGALATVISCPGGSGFEGDCDGSATLSTGRRYLRISYYNNAPSSADAIFSWQRPGDAGLNVVSTSALWTQAAPSAIRPPLIFVPGFGGSQLEAMTSRTRNVTTSDGGTKQVSYNAGDLIWLDRGRVIQATLDPEWFDTLRFNNDGTPPTPNDFRANGALVTLPGSYGDIEQTLTEAGYLRDQTFFVFTYDFRFGAETWTQQLDDLVVHALALNTGAPGVDIIAHSMGTLVTRAYLTSGPHSSLVHAAVLMGGPLLGTPQGNYAATAGQCLTRLLKAVCVLREQTEQYIIRTLPGGLELGASNDYYSFFRGQDRAHPVAYLDHTFVAGPKANRSDYGLLHDAELSAGAGPVALAQAESFHADDLSWLQSRPNAVSLVVGSGLCTIGQTVAYSKPTYSYRIVGSGSPPFFSLQRVFTGYATAYDTTEIDGDGTVVRQSAALTDAAVGLSANGASPVYYRPLAHGALAEANDLRDTALPLIRGEAVPAGSVAQPQCTQVSTHSPVELLVTDGTGRQVGRSSPTDPGSSNVPGATYDKYLDMTNIALNVRGQYVASVSGTGSGDATIRVRWVQGSDVARMAMFAHVPTTSKSRGSFTIDDVTRTAGDLTIDVNGDGATMTTFSPVILDGAAAEDTTAPDLKLDSPQQGQAVVGRFPVSWTATDAGSGIGTTQAALDLATNGPQLSTPGATEVTPGDHTLDVFAEDRAGNTAAQNTSFTAYAYEWAQPLAFPPGNGPVFKAGRTIPARFAVRRADGTTVADPSVLVDLVNGAGQPVTPSAALGPDPATGVVLQNGIYHADLRTSGLVAGSYMVRVRFSSPHLVGELDLQVVLQ